MHPLLDTDSSAATAFCDAPLVRLSAGLTDAITSCAAAGRPLTLITPEDSRVTFPPRSLAMTNALTWLARAAPGQCFGALSGARLALTSGAPIVDADLTWHDAWLPRADQGCDQLLCSVAVQHHASASMRLIGADALARGLTGRPPAGWATSEPVNQPWDVDALTSFARRRAPEPTRLIAVGERFQATIAITRTTLGVQEDVTALVSAAASRDEVGDAAAETLAAMAEQMTVGFAVAHHRMGRADLTAPARYESPPVPAAMLVGPRACRQLGLAVLESAPIRAPRRVGHERLPGLLWRFDGDFDTAWSRIGALVEYLGPERIAEAAASGRRTATVTSPERPPSRSEAHFPKEAVWLAT